MWLDRMHAERYVLQMANPLDLLLMPLRAW